MGEDLPVSFSLCAAFVVLVSAGTLTNVYLFRLYGTKSGSEMPGPRRGWAQSWEFPASSLGDFLHAMDFLRYSYLQSGQEAKAREVIEHTNHVVGANKESKADYHALFCRVDRPRVCGKFYADSCRALLPLFLFSGNWFPAWRAGVPLHLCLDRKQNPAKRQIFTRIMSTSKSFRINTSRISHKCSF